MRQIVFTHLLMLLCLFAGISKAYAEPPLIVQAEQEEEQAAQEPVSYERAFTRMMLTLLGLLVLIVLSVWMLRRISSGRLNQLNYGRTIKVLERRPLSPKSVLYLIEISGKKVLIAESHLEVRRLTDLSEMETQAEGEV